MPTIHLEVLTIEEKVIDEEVNMVVAPGSEGVLGILPRHTPLLTALTYGELQIKQDGKEDQFYAISGGYMEVLPHQVIILANTAERAEEIDIERAEAAKRRAEESLDRTKDQGEDFDKLQAAHKRSMLRLSVAGRRRRGKHLRN